MGLYLLFEIAISSNKVPTDLFFHIGIHSVTDYRNGKKTCWAETWFLPLVVNLILRYWRCTKKIMLGV